MCIAPSRVIIHIFNAFFMLVFIIFYCKIYCNDLKMVVFALFNIYEMGCILEIYGLSQFNGQCFCLDIK